jgi:hypothetical protein
MRFHSLKGKLAPRKLQEASYICRYILLTVYRLLPLLTVMVMESDDCIP